MDHTGYEWSDEALSTSLRIPEMSPALLTRWISTAIAAAFLTTRFRTMLPIIGSGILLVDSIMPPTGKNTMDCLSKITRLCVLPHPVSRNLPDNVEINSTIQNLRYVHFHLHISEANLLWFYLSSIVAIEEIYGAKYIGPFWLIYEESQGKMSARSPSTKICSRSSGYR